MITHTHTRTFAHFILNDTLPQRLVVRDTADLASVTRFYSVIADYGWAERILCSESYLNDANSIAVIIGDYLDIPVVQAVAVLAAMPEGVRP